MEKYLLYYQLLNHWLEAKHYGHNVAEYFHLYGYKNISIYGLGDMAERLMEDLSGSDIKIVYGVDRDLACSLSMDLDTYSLEEEWPRADVMVVTPITSFEQINELVKGKARFPIISLEEVVWSI
jgi:hypothetical protein